MLREKVVDHFVVASALRPSSIGHTLAPHLLPKPPARGPGLHHASAAATPSGFVVALIKHGLHTHLSLDEEDLQLDVLHTNVADGVPLIGGPLA